MITRATHTLAVVLAALTCAWSALGQTAERPRVASINVCTDQLLLALADPAQIVGLSPYAREPAWSFAAAQARRYPRLSGDAEDVMVLKPDLVVAGTFTKRATREFLKEQGVRVVEFDVARTLDEAKEHITQMGELVGHPDRAAAEVARIDAAIARARAAAARTPYRVLVLSRRGWASGSGGLMTSLLSAAGLLNAAADFGVVSGGFVSLEQIVVTKPDLLLVAQEDDVAEDQGRAFLMHPALAELYPPSKRLVVPERLTVCGGPTMADALDRLTAEIARVGR